MPETQDYGDSKLPGDIRSRKTRTLFICASIELLTSLGTSISSVPSIRLIESAICQRILLAATSPPEHLCKTTAIQSQMAQLLGAMSSFASLPTLLLALPFSILSEHVDRRGVLLANLCAGVMGTAWILGICWFAFPVLCYYPNTDLRLIWMSGLFDIVGGGGSVAQIILRSMISESVPSSTLCTVLYRLSGLNLLLRLFGTSFGSWLLQNGSASTILVGLSIHGLTIPILTFLPRNYLCRSKTEISEYELCNSVDCQDENINSTKGSNLLPSPTSPSAFSALFDSLKSFKHLLLQNRAFATCLALVFLSTISLSARSLLRPWMSKRYSWSLSVTGYILSLESLLGALIFFILQYIDSSNSTLSGPEKRRQEIRVAKISLGFGILGTVGLALAKERWQFVLAALVISCSVGFWDALRAFFTAKVIGCGGEEGAKNVQRLYSAMEVVQYLAIIGTAPMWSAVYSLGYRVGGFGMGMPFFGSAGFMGLVLLVVWRLCRE